MISENSRNRIQLWLIAVSLLTASMVVVGGVTRLTDSGLSMVEWRPLLGLIPPLNQAEWSRVFELYKAYPEYQVLNSGMSLSEFKFIFMWEYGHRLLGRVLGIAFFVPFLYFTVTRQYHSKLFVKLIIGLGLGLSQGLLGWYMVQSGLVDLPHVSHFRLAAHLSLALVIIFYLSWLIIELRESAWEKRKGSPLGLNLLTLLFVLQIIFGAFVAGKKAGLGFNSFPTMNGEWFPSAILALEPWYHNALFNNVAIQFIHRWLGMITLISVFTYVATRSTSAHLRSGKITLIVLTLLQVAFGIATLLLAVPVALAAIHQFMAVLIVINLSYLHFHTRWKQAHVSVLT